jgi:glycosyltransferase involved in cell wall biosynthesis
MKRASPSKSKMAVIRQIQPPEALFYDAFQRMDVRFIFTTQNPSLYPVKTQNLQLVNLQFKPKWFLDPIAIFNRGIYTNRSWVKAAGLEKQLKDVDVVNISSLFYAWSGQDAKLAKKLGKKLVAIIWENIPHHPSTFIPPYSFSVKEAAKSTDLFILRSKLALRFTDSLRIPRKKVKVIYKGVDLSVFHSPLKSRPLGKKQAKIKILYVGRLIISKGVVDLLSAFAKLSKESREVELLIAGAGPLEKKVRRFSQSYPVCYKGYVNYKNLPELYRQADIFSMPSREIKYLNFIKVCQERFSYALIEALASGLPIVATKCGGIPEEVGDRNFLVDQGNVEQLYQSLKKLVKDRILRQKLGHLNRKRAEKLFDLKKQAKKTEEAILSLL